MSRESRASGGSPFELCHECTQRGTIPDKFVFAQVWWTSGLFTDDQVALCDACAFELCAAILTDVVAGGKFTIGDITETMVRRITRAGIVEGRIRNPYLRPTHEEWGPRDNGGSGR